MHEWFPWCDEFSAAVDSKPNLPDINKFIYLRTYTADGGTVEQAMKGFYALGLWTHLAAKLVKSFSWTCFLEAIIRLLEAVIKLCRRYRYFMLPL